MTPIIFKRGQTFSAVLSLSVTIDDVPVPDLTGFTGVSQARRENGQLVETLTFGWADAASGQATIASAGTDAWPLGVIEIDAILTAPGGEKVATPTVTLKVIQGPTDV